MRVPLAAAAALSLSACTTVPKDASEAERAVTLLADGARAFCAATLATRALITDRARQAEHLGKMSALCWESDQPVQVTP
jgi:starvation-inducible outer membrane lipoprotein